MGNMLGGGGGGSGGGLGGLLDPLGLFKGGSEGGGGFLSNLLGGLPDPLGVGKMLGITGQPQTPQGGPPGAGGPPPPAGASFAPQPGSGASIDTSQMRFSPMSQTGFGVGGGKR